MITPHTVHTKPTHLKNYIMGFIKSNTITRFIRSDENEMMVA